MGKESNNIIRTKDVATENSEVELYLDTDVLVRTIIQFEWLSHRLGQWAAEIDRASEVIVDSTGGLTSTAIVNFNGKFSTGDFDTLRTNTDTSIEIMRENALVAANKLRLQCEHFYEIVVGNVGGATQPSLTPKLYLDTTYYDAGVIDTNTTDAATRLKNIDDEDNDLYGILLSFHYKEHLEDCSADIESIHSDCKNRTRLQVLERAFDNYVRDVKRFNEDIAEKFNGIIDPRMALDHKRTYEYPRIKDEKEQARMDRIIRNELHEMGFSDKAIDNAIGKGSFTLNELAAYAEKIVIEDGAQNNDGEEIKLVVSVLEGDATAAYNKYGKKLADKAEAGWECIATYQMGLLHTVCFGDVHKFKPNDGAEAFNNYINEMNATLQSDNAFYVMKALKGGAYNALRECGKHYLENTTTENAFKNAQYREKYRKNFLLYDSYNFIHQMMSEDEQMNKAPQISKDGYRCGNYKLYNIESMRYDNAGIHFTIMESEYMGGTKGGLLVPENSFEPIEYKANQFEMNIQTHIGTAGVNAALSEYEDSKQVENAYKEQKEMLIQMEKDGLLVASAAAGGPLVAEGVAVGLNVLNGDTDIDAIKDVIKPGARELAGTLTESAGGQNAVYRGSGLLVDAYDYMSSTSVQAARDNEQANSYARLAGSAGYCTIVDSGKTTQILADNHAGLYTPGHEKAVLAVKTDGVGLKDLCGWDEKTVEKVEAQLGICVDDSDAVANKYKGNNEIREQAAMDEKKTQNVSIDTLKSIIEGGYKIDGNTDYTELKNGLKQIDDAYKVVGNKNDENAYSVFEAWDKDIEDFTDEPEKDN